MTWRLREREPMKYKDTAEFFDRLKNYDVRLFTWDFNEAITLEEFYHHIKTRLLSEIADSWAQRDTDEAN